MSPGFKYHLVTVSAIFFALTIGLVIGSLYLSPQLAERQNRAIDALRVALDRDVREQRERVQRYEDFFEQALPSLVQRRLLGASVALVQVGDYPELTEKVRDTLQLADATIFSRTTLLPGLSRPEPLLKSTLSAVRKEAPGVPADRQELIRTLASLLTGSLNAPETVIEPLARAGLIQYDRNSDYTRPTRFVVLIAGSQEANSRRHGNLDALLIAELQKRNAIVVMCEPSGARFSDVEAYRELNLQISMIDNADQDIGRCALVYALRGEPGTYGIKPVARRLFPPPLRP
ncbi:MAG: copper transporter [Chloroherpetonaceae bacterium]|nr:copper transporter [Chthonomonadaceae bacterium]MDW8207546.1 copper transporter [Chloroherpetonaceae bacterium]